LFTWGFCPWGAGHPKTHQLVPAVPEELEGKMIVYVRPLPDYADGILAVDQHGNVWRPRFHVRSNKCPWVQQTITSELLQQLGLPPPLAKLIAKAPFPLGL